jgi:hypothetical protein
VLAAHIEGASVTDNRYIQVSLAHVDILDAGNGRGGAAGI